MRRFDFALIAILLLAFAVRIWGITFGLPLTVCRPDEGLVVQPALEYFGGDFDPKFYAYGTLGSYLLHALMRVQLLFELAAGHIVDSREFVQAALLDPGHWHLVARCSSAIAGVATVWLVYLIGHEVQGRRVALTGAFLLALCYLHARDSHFGTLDVLATFFTTAAVYFSLRALNAGSTQALLFAGACVGFAAATKYGGAMAACAVLAAGLCQQAAGWRVRTSRLALAGFASAGAFFLAMPYAAIAPRAVLAALRRESEHLAQGGGVDLGSGYLRHLTFTLPNGMGLLLFIAAIVGAYWLGRGHGRRAMTLLAFPVVYLAFAGRGQTVFVRYMLPLTPLLCALAAVAVMRAADLLQARWGTRARFATALLTLVLAAAPAWSLIQFDLLLDRPDSRLLARDWLLANAPPGASVAQTGNFARTQLPAESQVRENALRAWAAMSADRSATARSVRARFPVLQTIEGAGYPIRRWVESRNEFVSEGGIASGDPDYVILSSSPLLYFDPPTPEGLARVLAERYVLVTRIGACDPLKRQEEYDAIDQFYLPYRSFAGVERPGPNLAIYARR